MRKSFKRVAAALMSAVLFFTGIPEMGPVFEKARAERPNFIPEEVPYEVLSLDQTVVVDNTVGQLWYEFTPESDGLYVFSSSGENADPMVLLYDDEGNNIRFNDNSADEREA